MRFCLNMTSVRLSVKFTQFITLKKDCKTIHFIDIIQRCSLSSVADFLLIYKHLKILTFFLPKNWSTINKSINNKYCFIILQICFSLIIQQCFELIQYYKHTHTHTNNSTLKHTGTVSHTHIFYTSKQLL
jgi:hypothetical protein